MRLILTLVLIICNLPMFSQSGLKGRIGVSGSFAKMGIPSEHSFVRTGLTPGFTLSISYCNVFHVSNIQTELNYSLDGHKFRVHNFFEEKTITATYQRQNIGITFFWLQKVPISDNKKPRFNFFVKPGIWVDYIINTSYRYNQDITVRSKIGSKSVNWGAVICIELVKRKSRKHNSYDLDLRYYYGTMNLSKQKDSKWFSRRYEIGYNIPLWPKRSKY